MAGNYARVGGFDYLQSLVNCVPSAANWRAYTDIVRGKYQQRVERVDQGESDKRLMPLDPEFSRLLKVAARDGNTVSAMIRLAWDNGDLHVLTRTPTKSHGRTYQHYWAYYP